MQTCIYDGQPMRRIHNVYQKQFDKYDPIELIPQVEGYECPKCKKKLFRSTWTCPECGKIHPQEHTECYDCEQAYLEAERDGMREG